MSAMLDERVARGMKAQLELRRGRIASGAKPIGWKVGFGAPAAMAKLKIAAPLTGFLLDRGVVASDATVSLAGWIKPVAEPEIAVEMRTDLARGGGTAAAADAIGALGPAIELADLEAPPEDVETILAGNIFHRFVLFGPRDRSRAGGKIEGLHARVRRNDAILSETDDLETNTGKIVDIVRHVADLLAACGERLAAGDIIIAGSVVAPIFLSADDRSVGLTLDPVGSVAVRFSAA
jgi:2-keto-4-pentenoate hydratase